MYIDVTVWVLAAEQILVSRRSAHRWLKSLSGNFLPGRATEQHQHLSSTKLYCLCMNHVVGHYSIVSLSHGAVTLHHTHTLYVTAPFLPRDAMHKCQARSQGVRWVRICTPPPGQNRPRCWVLNYHRIIITRAFPVDHLTLKYCLTERPATDCLQFETQPKSNQSKSIHCVKYSN